MASIKKVADRERLKARNAPYFDTLGQGRALGYRKTTPASAGTWIARWRDPDTGKQNTRSLGPLDTLPPSARYEEAKELAAKWFQHLGHGGTAEAVTVRMACERYAENLKHDGREKTAVDVERRFNQYVFNHTIAGIELAKLAPRHVEDWRRWLANLPTPRGVQRSADSLNRDMVCLKSALNYAHSKRLIATNTAWMGELKPTAGTGQRRDLYLSRDQRQKMIDAADQDMALFMRALCVLPLRPGAMAALDVGDFDRRLSTLRVRADKAGKGRSIALPPEASALLIITAQNKLPTAPLFTRADGSRWDKTKWVPIVKRATEAANMPPGTTLYTLRHSLITDLVQTGADLATVATISGTSVLMIQKHYHHLQQSAVTQALSKVAL